MKRRDFLKGAGVGVVLGPLTAITTGLSPLLLGGCSRDPGTGPVPVTWDRDACTRCDMVLSDHYHAAEVRGAPAGKPTRVYKFDDVGCAVIWLDKQPWRNDPRTEVWVADHHDGHWLDARSVHYVTGEHTPMAYGLGALAKATEGSLTFKQARAHIYQVEKRFNSYHAPTNTQGDQPK